MGQARQKLGDILIRWGLVSSAQVSEALALASQRHIRVGEALVELGFVGDANVAKALASQLDIEYVDLTQPNAVDPIYHSLLAKELIEKYDVIPYHEANGQVEIITHDPTDEAMLSEISAKVKRPVIAAVAGKSAIERYIQRHDPGHVQVGRSGVFEIPVEKNEEDFGPERRG